MLEKTYQIEVCGPAPLSWDAFETLLETKWKALLDREPAATEREIQIFLQDHPCLIPGAFNLIGGRSGHYPHLCSVVSQAPLPSYNPRIPDFMWLSRNSEADQPVLVEIEAPGKKWWTQSGQPTADLTQALNQITEWKAWFDTPHNVQSFKAFYGLDRDNWEGRAFQPAYALIYGRRNEANASPSLTAKRAHMVADDVVLMTYDRLRPDRNAAQLFCVTKGFKGFTAVSVPPTMTWGPAIAPYRRVIHGKEAAIRANPYLSTERKDFLIARAPYWDAWSARDRLGVISTGDRE